MAVVGISRSDSFEYVLNSDPSKRVVPLAEPRVEDGQVISDEVVVDPDATVFKLGVLDLFLMGSIYDAQTHVTRAAADGQLGVNTRVNHTNIEAVRYGLRGWKNFLDAKGEEIQFKTVKHRIDGREYQTVADECLTRLGIAAVQELAQQIKEKSEVSRREAKNSATAS